MKNPDIEDEVREEENERGKIKRREEENIDNEREKTLWRIEEERREKTSVKKVRDFSLLIKAFYLQN